MPINLNGVRMRAIHTAPGGVVNAETVFQFHQQVLVPGATAEVWAEYSGGKILRGSLIGVLQGTTLTFRYCQLQVDGILDGGNSVCEVRRMSGKMQVVERFQWESREGSGENIFEEIAPNEQ